MFRWFNNLSVKLKLASGFGLVLLLTLLIAVTGWINLSGVISRGDKLGEISELIAIAKDLRITRLKFQSTRTPEDARLVGETLDLLDQRHRALKERFSEDEDRHVIEQQHELAVEYRRLFSQLLKSYEGRDTAKQTLIRSAGSAGEAMEKAEKKLVSSGNPENLQHMADLASLGRLMMQARLQVMAYTSTDAQSLEQNAFNALQQVIQATQNDMKDSPAELNAELAATLQALEAYRNALTTYRNEVNESQAARDRMRDAGTQIEKLSIDLTTTQTAKRDAGVAQAKTLLTLAALIALALGVVAAWLITGQIVNPLREVLGHAERIADGDLSRNIPTSRSDELGQLQKSMQRMNLSLRELIGRIHDGVTQIASAAEELSAVTEQTSAGVNNQKTETDQVATAMNEMAATVQEVARNAEEASEAASAADREAREGEGAVNEAVGQMDRLANEVDRSNESVLKLKRESEKIGSVLDVIKAVAEQTNLLALNAAIEAARAGDAGRGFAVVADEVRALAQRTQSSTEEIEELIAGLQSGTQQAVQMMETSRDLTVSTVDLTRRAGERLGAITRTVSTIQSMNQQIAAASEQQSAVAEEINRSVMNVRDISEQTAAASEETAASSVELARLGNELQMLVSRFRV
ncbi:methyl-accepting chemotaxis protein [Pseudomonas sp. ZM23]|uniref:Methyl-accepting chemotaxis protein n=2 Tax=Pseudomonas triclosanedens TaxID=2961893 RepID=A0ABY6ZZN5_9PSED|nr:methyl-accepting chemotaxis protein [Pseudomonas triclosanedens]MCP8462959.1 methyl-accepting chemotaxis protein [Pseudomonas triclosanedens]MCP8468579.1 methyl-accepting chemotaxis protein [Pseudomonas triclosanedens]MCP8475301.1 methyl-accepting chemotaxis protein [Pseudomonas triclosanedens]WAI50135.1 methyl-accepting chemotaxis protein [Pseudomonas triclosanedens]